MTCPTPKKVCLGKDTKEVLGLSEKLSENMLNTSIKVPSNTKVECKKF